MSGITPIHGGYASGGPTETPEQAFNNILNATNKGQIISASDVAVIANAYNSGTPLPPNIPVAFAAQASQYAGGSPPSNNLFQIQINTNPTTAVGTSVALAIKTLAAGDAEGNSLQNAIFTDMSHSNYNSAQNEVVALGLLANILPQAPVRDSILGQAKNFANAKLNNDSLNSTNLFGIYFNSPLNTPNSINSQIALQALQEGDTQGEGLQNDIMNAFNHAQTLQAQSDVIALGLLANLLPEAPQYDSFLGQAMNLANSSLNHVPVNPTNLFGICLYGTPNSQTAQSGQIALQALLEGDVQGKGLQNEIMSALSHNLISEANADTYALGMLVNLLPTTPQSNTFLGQALQYATSLQGHATPPSTNLFQILYTASPTSPQWTAAYQALQKLAY